jgi:hypothetical protein
MLARKRFRLSLYKLMLFKNIVENKVHKEKMQMLYAFEQMIINTEDEDYYEEAGYEEDQIMAQSRRPPAVGNGELSEVEDGEYGDDDLYGEEADQRGDVPHAALSYYQRTKNFPPMQRIPVEAEYMSNPSDVIDEEEFEDSETDPASPLKKHHKVAGLPKTNPAPPLKPASE